MRPLPAWLRTLRLSPGPPAKVPPTGRLLWLTSVGFLLLGAVLLVVLQRSGPDPDRIGDRAFAAAAEARCEVTERTVVTPNLGALEGPAEVRRIERLAAGWEEMVVDIRGLPLASIDAPSVDRWLRAWDQWTSYGHDYADAVAAGDNDEAKRILEASETPNAAMSHFARVNGMDGCVFR